MADVTLYHPNFPEPRTVPERQARVMRKSGWSDEPVKKPSMSWSKDELEAFAVESGWAEEEAEQATKSDIVEAFG